MPKECLEEHAVFFHVIGGPATRLKYVKKLCRSWKNLAYGDSLDKRRLHVSVATIGIFELETLLVTVKDENE